jgi:hypothetical protein
VSTRGVLTGVEAIGLYGLGMALLVSGLTITLAMANTAMLKALRKGMEWFEYLAGVFVLLTGLYLTWYWYTDIKNQSSSVVTGAVNWQERLSRFVQSHQYTIVVLASVIIAAAIGYSVVVKRRQAPE